MTSYIIIGSTVIILALVAQVSWLKYKRAKDQIKLKEAVSEKNKAVWQKNILEDSHGIKNSVISDAESSTTRMQQHGWVKPDSDKTK